MDNIQKIKVDFLDAYDKVIEDGFEPTLPRVLGRIPYLVNPRFAQEIRRDLVLSGDLPEPRRGGVPRKPVPSEDKRIVFYLDKDAILKRMEEVRTEVIMREQVQNEAIMSGEADPPWDSASNCLDNTAAAKWAIRRFQDAWRSIRELLVHRDPAVAPDAAQQAPGGALAGTIQAEATRPRYSPGVFPALSRPTGQQVQAPG